MRLVPVLFLLGLPVLADAGDLERAADLRNASTQDWNDQRYTDAAAKLREAAAIYERLDGPLADWAVTMRALVWNLVRAGDENGADAAFGKLAVRLRGKADLVGELWSAYGAYFEKAKGLEAAKDARAVVQRCRDVFLENGFAAHAAQTLHDAGGFAATRGDVDAGVQLYREAIREREAIGDAVGIAWSRNNIAYHLLRTGRHAEAGQDLLAAYRAVHEDGVAEPQGSVAINLRTLLEAWEREGASGAQRGILASFADAAAKSKAPRIVPADRIARVLLATASGEERTEAARRVATLEIVGVPAEVRADLTLRAYEAALAAGAHADAAKWFGVVVPGDGPVGPHLAARLETLGALAQAAAGRGEDFLEGARRAAAKWNELGDFAGRRAALLALRDAVRDAGLEQEAAELLAQWEAALQAGGPGGAGGSSSSGGDRGGYGALGLLDPLFEIESVDGSIRVTDLVSGKQWSVPVEWKPRNVSYNGVSLTVFGGYVVVRSASYGGASVSSGAPGASTLDDLGEYLPVPARGKLVLLKNGALAYR